jgi:hypothetical protein
VAEERFLFPTVTKVPSPCPLFLLVEVILREGKGLGSEKLKCYEQRREFELGLYCACSELILMLTLEGLH